MKSKREKESKKEWKKNCEKKTTNDEMEEKIEENLILTLKLRQPRINESWWPDIDAYKFK